MTKMATDTESAPDGFQQLGAMLAGELKAPMGEKLGFTLVELERGRVVFEGTPDRSHYNPLGSVHGGYAATLLDSACGIAVHSQLSANQGHTTLELKVSVPARPQRAEWDGPRGRPRPLARASRGVRGSDAARWRGTPVRHGDFDAPAVRRQTRSVLTSRQLAIENQNDLSPTTAAADLPFKMLH